MNRVWQHFFGRGLVFTTENFGSQGEPPSHPELLDWLARDFIAHGWDMKRLCRQIVLSATYGQDSKATRHCAPRDPANILLARGPGKTPFRRGTPRPGARHSPACCTACSADRRQNPILPDSATWRVLNSFLPEYQRDKAAPASIGGASTAIWRRTAPPPGMLAFDVPGRDVCTVRRQQTNTPAATTGDAERPAIRRSRRAAWPSA